MCSCARGGAEVSTLDLFGAGLSSCSRRPPARPGAPGARAAADEIGLALDAQVVGAGDLQDPEAAFPDAYGITAAGAVLVRPDGVVGWRAVDGAGASDGNALRDVLTRLLCRP